MKGNLGNMLLDPMMVLNKNWYRMQDFGQQSSLNFMADAYGKEFRRFVFQYRPSKKESAASLSFHLTPAEKRDIAAAVMNESNQAQFDQILDLFRKQ
jgi:hypothetical protein